MNANWRKENAWALQLAEGRDSRILSATPVAEPGRLNQLVTWTKRKLRSVAASGVNVENLVQRGKDGDKVTLICGRRGETAFEREDGLRCLFKMNFLEENKSLKLLSYALEIRSPSSDSKVSPLFLRWEYVFEKSERLDPIFEPQSHLHPGHRDIRVPAPVLSPKELIALFLGLQKW